MSNDNLISFPKSKIIREVTVTPEAEVEIEKVKMRGLKKFVDDIMEDLITNIFDELGALGIDTETSQFKNDFTIAIDFLRATVYRTADIEHPLQSLIDESFEVSFDNEERGTTISKRSEEKFNDEEIDDDQE